MTQLAELLARAGAPEDAMVPLLDIGKGRTVRHYASIRSTKVGYFLTVVRQIVAQAREGRIGKFRFRLWDSEAMWEAEWKMQEDAGGAAGAHCRPRAATTQTAPLVKYLKRAGS